MAAILAICIGASVGALARWQLGMWLNQPQALLPWGTLMANLVGGLLIGLCIAVFQAWPNMNPAWRLLLVTGFLGGLTTFSTFSAEVAGFLLAQRYALAFGVTALHVAGSLLATIVGIKLGTVVLQSLQLRL